MSTGTFLLSVPQGDYDSLTKRPKLLALRLKEVLIIPTLGS